MTKKELLQIFQDFSEQHGDTYEERCIYDNHFGEIADVLLKQPSSALDLIAAEREKQISKGYTVEHDQKYVEQTGTRYDSIAIKLIKGWVCPEGWNTEYWNRLINLPVKDQLRIAGAFIAAELERIIYVESKKEEQCN